MAGEKLSKQQFFRVLIPAFSGAFQPEVIRKGFKNTGIYPLNQDAPKLKQLGPSQVYNKCKLTVGWIPYNVTSDVISAISDLSLLIQGKLFSCVQGNCSKRVTRSFLRQAGHKTLIQFFIAITDEGAAQQPQEGEGTPQKPTEEPTAEAVVGEAVVMSGISGEADDMLGAVAANEDVEGDEEEEEDEEEDEEEEVGDPDAMDEDEYLAKVINKGGEVRKFQAGH